MNKLKILMLIGMLFFGFMACKKDTPIDLTNQGNNPNTSTPTTNISGTYHGILYRSYSNYCGSTPPVLDSNHYAQVTTIDSITYLVNVYDNQTLTNLKETFNIDASGSPMTDCSHYDHTYGLPGYHMNHAWLKTYNCDSINVGQTLYLSGHNPTSEWFIGTKI